MGDFFNKFKTPSHKFGSAPFWSWNGRLLPDELERQIEYMYEQGWGGFFMHSRCGLITPYLSNEWMKAIKTCIDKAKQLNMDAWLYDEDRWPSGFAGGIIPKKGKKYRQKALIAYPANKSLNFLSSDEKEHLSVIYSGVQIKLKDRKAEKFNFAIYTVPPGNKYFNNWSYVDLLDIDVTNAFIKSTHEKYKKLFKNYFGNVVPGIFTDEPAFHKFDSTKMEKFPCVPWTTKLPTYFKNHCNYDIINHLPEIFFNINNYKKIRYDFWRCLTLLFIESFTKPVFDWCEKENLSLTGHFMCEDNLLQQTMWIGAAMPHYEYMQQPGIDFLGRGIGYNKPHPKHTQFTDGGLLTAKQCSSVANQLGKKRVLSELYGCSGQNMSLADRKWIGDWHLINGINFFCPHLSLFSMCGERKRDFPPNIFFQQPWWNETRALEDYQKRLCYILSLGKRVTKILLLHPIGTTWAQYTPIDLDSSKLLDRQMKDLTKYLCELHYDYDFGDEILMKKYTKIKGNKFIIGNAEYDTIIIPPSETWDKNTVLLLDKFKNNGGKIISIKPCPSLINGEPSNFWHDWLKDIATIKLNKNQLNQILNKYSPNDIDIYGADGKNADTIWLHHRKYKEKDIIFFANIEPEKNFNSIIKLPHNGNWAIWDPITGTASEIQINTKKSQYFYNHQFSPAGSLLLIGNKNQKSKHPKEFPKIKKYKTVNIKPIWRFKRQSPNALTLDFCKLKIGNGKWSKKLYILDAQKIIRKQEPQKDFFIEFEFNNEMPNSTLKNISLVIETPEKYKVSINSHQIKVSKSTYWLDPGFRVITLDPDYIKIGKNVITLQGTNTNHTEIESIYIIGDFAVHNSKNKEFILTSEPDSILEKEITTQGYPFYTGIFSISQNLNIIEKGNPKSVVLDISEMNFILAKIFVNNKYAGKLWCKPFKFDIAPFLIEGQNEIKIDLYTSLHNLLGPHHDKRGELRGVSPESFQRNNFWTTSYTFIPYKIGKAKLLFFK